MYLVDHLLKFANHLLVLLNLPLLQEKLMPLDIVDKQI